MGTRLRGGNLSIREVTSPIVAGFLHAHTGVNEEGKQGFITQAKPKIAFTSCGSLEGIDYLVRQGA